VFWLRLSSTLLEANNIRPVIIVCGRRIGSQDVIEPDHRNEPCGYATDQPLAQFGMLAHVEPAIVDATAQNLGEIEARVLRQRLPLR
jgi:hypothetical protein